MRSPAIGDGLAIVGYPHVVDADGDRLRVSLQGGHLALESRGIRAIVAVLERDKFPAGLGQAEVLAPVRSVVPIRVEQPDAMV